jgi:hypothetical protein
MEKYLGMIGLLFFIFFLVATATEAILEFLRRPLEWFRITPPKPKMSLEEAVKLSADFVPNGSTTAAKLDAIQSFVRTGGKALQEKEVSLIQLKKDIVAATTPALQNAVSASTVALFSEINELLDRNDDYRVRMLRSISFLFALIICVTTGTNAIDLVVQSNPELLKSILRNLYGASEDGKLVLTTWANAVGFFLTAAAAASGSSYWHDQLDKVRSLKSARAQITQLSV